MRSDDILAQIDTALEDWTVSGDAMRSMPAPERPEAARPRLWIAPVDTSSGGAGWQEVGYITDIEINQATIAPDDTAAQPTVTWEEVRERFARIEAERVRHALAVLHALQEALRPAADEAGRVVAELAARTRAAGQARADDYALAPPRPTRDRPAWQSPYGPARRRR